MHAADLQVAAQHFAGLAGLTVACFHAFRVAAAEIAEHRLVSGGMHAQVMRRACLYALVALGAEAELFVLVLDDVGFLVLVDGLFRGDGAGCDAGASVQCQQILGMSTMPLTLRT